MKQFVTILLMGILIGCSEPHPGTHAAQDMGQELHGGDLAVAKLRVAILRYIPDWEESEVWRSVMSEPAFSEVVDTKAPLIQRGSSYFIFDRQRIMKSDSWELAKLAFRELGPANEAKLISLDPKSLMNSRLHLYVKRPSHQRFIPAPVPFSHLHQTKLTTLQYRSRKLIEAINFCANQTNEYLDLSALTAIPIVSSEEPIYDMNFKKRVDFGTFLGSNPYMVVDTRRIEEWSDWDWAALDYLILHEHAHVMKFRNSKGSDDNYLTATRVFEICHPYGNHLFNP